ERRSERCTATDSTPAKRHPATEEQSTGSSSRPVRLSFRRRSDSSHPRYDWLVNKTLQAGYFLYAMLAYGLGLVVRYIALNL
ncbi:Signal peptide peptidase-like 2, partial [Linum perenne]